MGRRFFTLDVFTGQALAGNPLAVVLDGQGLGDAGMQAIAREFNLSETVFVLPPEDQHQRASIRIFTPTTELPFAGHPTVGTAVLLGLLDHGARHGALAFGLEEKVGLVPCAVEIEGEGRGQATFTLPRLPERVGELGEVADIAAALDLSPDDIGFDNHVPARYSAGVPYALVPLSGRDALDRAKRRPSLWAAAFGDGPRANAFLYCREPVDAAHAFHARMFAPDLGTGEDPATGSAVAAFAGAIRDFDRPVDGEHALVIEQGYVMGRPSQIALTLTISGGKLVKASIGGRAVVVSEGALFL
ncbi:PhzF family phenazine biosynthesis protein [Chelatococcus sp. SYSU_G07232]|uniref:PhzF family phenazine biosynthesis protein n=1 Tax=Chelatococcus albus TaxID=3047466 RepID=A0ABT7AGP8_9HYPH|nr:PhzF family phenazine biosynthesis protein [Chelatococcus sp. SYSU_G07232]MDJ1158550.1 PhzF family phenazine biosynthesis protein [Chelatococcus sp. SYSU_G07232]